MSIELTQIQNHQRILITGDRGSEIFTHCKKVLEHFNKPFDVISPDTESISEGPIVFIISNKDFNAYDPHIALIDLITPDTKSTFESLADSLPKSGTLVYNESDTLTKEIGSKERADVHRETYKNDTIEAAKSLLKRIGVNEARFNQAQ